MKKSIIFLLLLKSSCIFSQERLNEIVNPEISFLEDFSNNAKNWPQGENDSVGLKIFNEAYYTLAAKNNFILPKKLNSTSLSSERNLWRLSAEITYVDGKSFFGLLFGSFDSRITYAFMINGGGNFMVLKSEGAKNTILTQGKSAKINIGKGAVNILSIQTDNNYVYNYSDIRYYVNGSDVELSTKAEQDIIDASVAEKKKKNKEYDSSLELTLEDLENMQKSIVLHSLDPENYGTVKIGIITTRGAAANFDNIKLETKPNKGRIITYNNKWESDSYFTKYLAKDIAAEEQVEKAAQQNKKIKEAEAALNKARSTIARLSNKQLHPYGANIPAAVPDEKAVAWLQKFIPSFEGIVGRPLDYYPEKNMVANDDSSETYNVKHYLPGVDASIKAVINTKTKKANCVIPLAKGLTTKEAIALCTNYLANMAAAFEVIGKEYHEPTNVPVSSEIPRPLLINSGTSFIINGFTSARIDPRKDKQGTWYVVLYLFSK
jgi:hypothetical protein